MVRLVGGDLAGCCADGVEGFACETLNDVLMNRALGPAHGPCANARGEQLSNGWIAFRHIL